MHQPTSILLSKSISWPSFLKLYMWYILTRNKRCFAPHLLVKICFSTLKNWFCSFFLILMQKGKNKAKNIFFDHLLRSIFQSSMHILQITIFHMLDLCGKLSCTVSTPIKWLSYPSSMPSLCWLSLMWLINNNNKNLKAFHCQITSYIVGKSIPYFSNFWILKFCLKKVNLCK